MATVPPPHLVLATVLGCFFLVAGVGSVVPALVKDRYVEQFLPMMVHLFGEDSPLAPVLARASQVVIGLVEFAAGVLFVWGVFDPGRRRVLLGMAYGLMIALMGAFMVVLFALHHYELPKWNQFPAILAMLLLGWYVTHRYEGTR